MTINKKLLKIASRAAMTFTAHGPLRLDEFFAEILYISS